MLYALLALSSSLGSSGFVVWGVVCSLGPFLLLGLLHVFLVWSLGYLLLLFLKPLVGMGNVSDVPAFVWAGIGGCWVF